MFGKLIKITSQLDALFSRKELSIWAEVKSQAQEMSQDHNGQFLKL